ncbi:MAG: matrixin family metalloprotease, partial [Sideroxydans sp.]|nr:matrixin family metalloprotease [Sideroxydans sp.]
RIAGNVAVNSAVDAALQAGLIEAGRITQDPNSPQEIDILQVMSSGALGGAIDGALGVFANRGQILEKAPEIMQDMFGMIAQVSGRSAANTRNIITTDSKTLANRASQKLGNTLDLADTTLPKITGGQSFEYKGVLLLNTAPAKTKTLNEAAEWYRSERNKIGDTIDKMELSVREKIELAEKLKAVLLESAAATLYDKNLAATLKEAFAEEGVEILSTKLLAQGWSGSKLHAAILNELTAPIDKARKWFEPGACFAAGTLVHTKEGLVPIEQIKVGDLVLSKPENGGEQAYKRVLKTFAHAPATVMRVGYTLSEDPNCAHGITATLNHPFWIADKGWTAADNLPKGFNADGSKFELCNGQHALVRASEKIYISDQPGVGWMPNHMGDPQRPGHLWDYANHKLVANNVMALEAIQEYEMEDPYLKLPVFNLEVEDFHTYYVGKHGVWVHNTNCGGLSFEVNPPAPALSAELTNQPFVSRKELIAALEQKIPNVADRQNFTDTFLVRADKQSQAGLIAPDDMKAWLAFEEGVSGRIKSSDGVRWEYAKAFWDQNKGANGELSYLAVEGFELSATGLALNIDRKLSFVKANDTDAVLRLMDRIAMFLENEKNVNERWVFEFPEGKRLDKPDLFARRQAEDIFAKIRNDAPDALKFGTYVPDASGVFKLVETAAEAASNARISKMLKDGLIELRNAPRVAPVISQNVTAEGNLTNVATLTLSEINALLPQARQYWLDAGASAAVLNRATFAVADLPFGMAGQTANNLITFDTIGAGWGWYVDATPADQSEFQATAQATVFTAAPASEAENKLDLLTVLIHELGHVAGLLHTATANDVMSQYLVPGERRLPDAADMAVLQAQGAPYSVGNSTSTWVTLPTGTVYSNALNTLLQAVAFTANATLTNGSLNNGNGWATQGSVNIANGAAVMNEVSASQTRLSQVFLLNPTDRFLSFTLSGTALDDLTGAPDDAFEVALLDANTGASLLSGTGQTRTDAFLNLQADGTQNLANCVTCINNADGSRTYRVDLAGVPAGVAANLSFDLVGFEQNPILSNVEGGGIPQHGLHRGDAKNNSHIKLYA